MTRRSSLFGGPTATLRMVGCDAKYKAAAVNPAKARMPPIATSQVCRSIRRMRLSARYSSACRSIAVRAVVGGEFHDGFHRQLLPCNRLLVPCTVLVGSLA